VLLWVNVSVCTRVPHYKRSYPIYAFIPSCQQLETVIAHTAHFQQSLYGNPAFMWGFTRAFFQNKRNYSIH